MHITNIAQWGLGIDTEKPIIISGPCSAESAEQTLQSCLGAASKGAQILRAGIWKPRTRPNSFEGVGQVGLAWLKAAGQAAGLPVTTEVAKAEHVEQALAAGVDVLWVGARTTVNPFSVQEIADALQGVDIPVMVKNPINPDLPLWIGALERLHKAGIHRLAAIHRGFSVSNAAPYRNLPMWDIPIELRRRVPDIDIINDPSHIAGQRALLKQVAQKALDLNFDGLMIESHIRPDEAWSDAAQQVTAEGLGELLGSLVKRQVNSSDPWFVANLEALRSDIDQLDRDIIALLGKRMEVAREIGRYKKENNITILQISRWQEIFAHRLQVAESYGLSRRFAEALLQYVHEESIRQQTHVMNDSSADVN